MKILVVAACPFPCARGTPVRVQRLSEALVEIGHQVEVVTYPLGDTATGLTFTVHRVSSLPWYRYRGPGPTLTKLLGLDPLLVWRLREVLNQNRWDVLHAHHIEGLLVALAARRLARVSVPIIYDAHTWVGEELGSYGGPLGPLLARLGGWLDRVPVQRAEHVVAVTEQLRQRFIERAGLPGTRVSAIGNGIEAEFLERIAAACAEAPTRTNPPRVVFAGNLAAYQGVDKLLQAFARLRQDRPDVELHVLTDDDFSPLVAQCDQLGVTPVVKVRAVSLAGLPAELVRADVLVNPRTLCSGIPQKLLNYMASGRPVVSFAGSAKLVDDRVTARVVPDDDVEAFAAAMRELLDDPALGERLGRAAQTRLQGEFGWKASALKMETVYEQVRNTGQR